MITIPIRIVMWHSVAQVLAVNSSIIYFSSQLSIFSQRRGPAPHRTVCTIMCVEKLFILTLKNNLMLELTGSISVSFGTKSFQTLIHFGHTLKDSLLFPSSFFKNVVSKPQIFQCPLLRVCKNMLTSLLCSVLFLAHTFFLVTCCSLRLVCWVATFHSKSTDAPEYLSFLSINVTLYLPPGHLICHFGVHSPWV